MADNIRIDSHKLIYHPQEVSRWLNGENIYPIEIEVSLSNACNHRCIFCAVDYVGYKPVMMDKKVILDNLKEISTKGVKSVIYAGEGEPLLNKNAPDIINKTKQYGMDAAMSTNGVLMTKEISKECLKSLTWVRFSTAGIKDETYENIHQCRQGDLQKVLENMVSAVEVKKDQKLNTTLGVQLLLLPHNKSEIVEMAKELRKIGVDYFTIKPFSQHPQSKHKINVDYTNLLELENELNGIATEDFKIYFRANAMKNLSCERSYKKCLALPFMIHIDTEGNLWPCITFVGKEAYKYGNLYEESFVNIWEGKKKKEVIDRINSMNLQKNCREICRLDQMNKYLDELVNPGEHINFI